MNEMYDLAIVLELRCFEYPSTTRNLSSIPSRTSSFWNNCLKKDRSVPTVHSAIRIDTTFLSVLRNSSVVLYYAPFPSSRQRGASWIPMNFLKSTFAVFVSYIFTLSCVAISQSANIEYRSRHTDYILPLFPPTDPLPKCWIISLLKSDSTTMSLLLRYTCSTSSFHFTQ